MLMQAADSPFGSPVVVVKIEGDFATGSRVASCGAATVRRPWEARRRARVSAAVRGVSRRDRGAEGRDGVWTSVWTRYRTRCHGPLFPASPPDSFNLSPSVSRSSSPLASRRIPGIRLRMGSHVRESLANGWPVAVGGVGVSEGGKLARGSVARVYEAGMS